MSEIKSQEAWIRNKWHFGSCVPVSMEAIQESAKDIAFLISELDSERAAIKRLESALASRDEEIERLGTELANYDFRFIQKERENSNLRNALAARDVIIGVKDGALREALPSCDRYGCDKPALYEQTQRGHTWTECEEHADESIKLQPQYYLRYPLSKTALSIDPNEVAEAVEGMRAALENLSWTHPQHQKEIIQKALALYDKALKGVK